jgi:Ulp1 family protease
VRHDRKNCHYIDYYDTLVPGPRQLHAHMKKAVWQLYGNYKSKSDELIIRIHPIQRQSNMVDCGIYAFAISQDLLDGVSTEEICKRVYCNKDNFQMRQQVIQWFKEGKFEKNYEPQKGDFHFDSVPVKTQLRDTKPQLAKITAAVLNAKIVQRYDGSWL